MKEVRDLVKKGKTLEALEYLEGLVSGQNLLTVILLFGRFNSHNKDVLNGIQKLDETIINQIHKEIISICQEEETFYKIQKLPTPPPIKKLACDKKGYLLGRKEFLNKLYKSLSEESAKVVISGIGGLGKSTLVNFYINYSKYKKEYRKIFWVELPNDADKITDVIIKVFEEALNLNKISDEQKLQRISAYLNEMGVTTLLIIDNANDYEKISVCLEFLRKCKCKVIFTSRSVTINNDLTVLSLNKLQYADALKLFNHYAPSIKDLSKVPLLLENIDNHTLLIEFMAKSLEHNSLLQIEDLIEITQKQNFTDEILNNISFSAYHANFDGEIQVAKYLLELFPLQNITSEEQKLLIYFSLLPSKEIDTNILQLLFRPNSEKKARLELGQTLENLYRKGWLQKTEPNTFICDILIQHILRKQLNPTIETCKELLENIFKVTQNENEIYSNKNKYVIYLSLITVVLNWLNDEAELIANIYYNISKTYYILSDFEKAQEYIEKAISIFQKVVLQNDKTYQNAIKLKDEIKNQISTMNS